MTASTSKTPAAAPAPAPAAAPDPASAPAPSIRARGQLRVIAAIVLGVMFTMTTAAAQLLPGKRVPAPRAIESELARITEQRRARIAELQAAGERCHPATAHELARLLVMDGQWSAVRRFADDYEQRCGEDPIVRKWGNAPQPRPRVRIADH
jgi:hypothetical protein